MSKNTWCVGEFNMSPKSLASTVSTLDFNLDKEEQHEISNLCFNNAGSCYFRADRPGVCSHTNVPCKTNNLIKAIADANTTPVDDTINLKAGCTYKLVSVDNNTSALGATGLPLIADAATAGKLTINGNGATIERSSAKGMKNFRILAVAIGGDLTIKNVTLRNGKLTNDNGGSIYSNGKLTVIDSTITGNSAEFGGGIVSSIGPLTVINSLFNGNKSTRDGAGINSAGTLIVTRSTFSGNIAGIPDTLQGLGGGILIAEGKATVTDSTFSDNVAYGGAGGGGILNGGGGSSVLAVDGSTFTDNYGNGGALFNTEGSTMTVTNSTISGNQGFGAGGLYNAGTLEVTHSTISGNISTKFEGGGIANINAGLVTLGHTIVAGNTAPSGPDIFGLICSLGYNLIGNTSGATIVCDPTGNLLDEDALPLNLGPLQDNGGPTQTHALLAGSVAINAGNPAFVPPPDFDQRGIGFPRVVGGRIDIGAYESTP
jgi:hypothetical protein